MLFDDVDFRDWNRQTLSEDVDFQRWKPSLKSTKYVARQHFNVTFRRRRVSRLKRDWLSARFAVDFKQDYTQTWNRDRNRQGSSTDISYQPGSTVSTKLMFEILFKIDKSRCCRAACTCNSWTFIWSRDVITWSCYAWRHSVLIYFYVFTKIAECIDDLNWINTDVKNKFIPCITMARWFTPQLWVEHHVNIYELNSMVYQQ